MLPVGTVVRMTHSNDIVAIVGHDQGQCRILPLRKDKRADCSSLVFNDKTFYYTPASAEWISPENTTTLGQMEDEQLDTVLRSFVLFEIRGYHDQKFGTQPANISSVPASGKSLGAREMELLTESAMDFWLTTGRFNDIFEKNFSEFLGIKHVLTCNSGSSANLLAVAALTSPKLGEKRLKPGDEVITVAAGFPTTVNPLLHYDLVPVFVDVDIPTYNIDAKNLELAVTPKTKAIMLAHTLGNAFDVDAILKLAREHDLWVIEDCCDALGTRYESEEIGKDKLLGSFGHIATFSFYPAHHITMGEGGAVATNDSKLKKIIESFRDWGRDCWCPPGCDNTCNCRFDWQLGSLPQGYDHKYIYSHIGYNLKITDMQAAVGVGQLERLDDFIAIRHENFEYMTKLLSQHKDVLILPEATPKSTPSWFGYPITIKEGSGIDREELMRALTDQGIGIRLLFGGNLLRQPYFENVEYRVADHAKVDGVELPNTDCIMRHTFWIGIYHGIGKDHLNYIADAFKRLLQ